MANVNVKMEVIGEGIILATNANGDQRIFSADTQMQAAADKAYDWAYGNNVQSAEPDIQKDVQTVSKSASEEKSVDETDSTSEAAGNPTTASDQKVDTEVAPTEEPKKRRKRRTKAEIEAANQAKNEHDTETVNVSEQQASQESEESKDDFDFDFNDSDTVANANSDVTDAGAETHEVEDVDDFFDLLEDDGSTENHEDDFGDFTDIDFTDIDNSSSETASEVVTESDEDDKIKELGAVKITFATYKTPTPIEEIYQSSGGVALLKRALNNKLLKSQLKDNIRAYLEAKGDI